MLALQGAMERSQSDFRNAAYTGWLTGRLSGMADAATYPSFAAIIGVETPEADEPDPEAKGVGARLWIMRLNKGGAMPVLP